MPEDFLTKARSKHKLFMNFIEEFGKAFVVDNQENLIELPSSWMKAVNNQFSIKGGVILAPPLNTQEKCDVCWIFNG